MLREQLKGRAEAILERWYEDVLKTYSAQAFKAWTREKDPFANPVGHSLRAGMTAILAGLLDDADDETVRPGIDQALQIRAVQDLSPSQAVGFVFRLKDIVRDESRRLAGSNSAEELAGLERRIDEFALAAFDSFAMYRERVVAVRINELKRNIPWVVTRASQAAVERGPV